MLNRKKEKNIFALCVVTVLIDGGCNYNIKYIVLCMSITVEPFIYNYNVTNIIIQNNSLSGWQGQNCADDIDECGLPDSCLNNGTCLNTQGSYNCQCAQGFTGARCGEDIDECESKPCLNEGVCLNEVGRYECNCTDTGGWGIEYRLVLSVICVDILKMLIKF